MTDKNPKNTSETAVNSSAAVAKTTDTAREGELKSRTLPQADALKERFKAGSIPLQTDFADVIDLANMGRQAVGGAEDQNGPANGFTLSSEGLLELKPNEAKGINVDKDGVAVKVNTAKGLNVDNDGVYVPLGWGIGYGGDGLNVTCKVNGGLGRSKEGVWVTPSKGISVDQNGVGIKLAANGGLSADEMNGLKIAPEQMFQKGMVMMFAGTEAEMPKGWALCDGGGGRPDLRDRFVLGSTGFTNVNKTNSKKVDGFNENKQYMVSSKALAPEVSVTVNGSALTIGQIPNHNHYGGVRYISDANPISVFSEYGAVNSRTWGGNDYKYLIPLIGNKATANFIGQAKTSSTGNSEKHSHTASAIQKEHHHEVNVVPPYYILAFIIKV